MLKYVASSNAAKDNVVASNGVSGDLITRIVITETEVQHSGTYKCEPGAAPVASVQVHVLDGEDPHKPCYFDNCFHIEA